MGGYPIEYQMDMDSKNSGPTASPSASCTPPWPPNSAVGRRVIHKGNAEYLTAAWAGIRSVRDIEKIVVKTSIAKGTPV